VGLERRTSWVPEDGRSIGSVIRPENDITVRPGAHADGLGDRGRRRSGYGTRRRGKDGPTAARAIRIDHGLSSLICR
jgi:hypothetical protein